MTVMFSSRLRLPASTRKIGGYWYRFMEGARTKREAEERADWWRSKGSQGVRITPFGERYSIYVRTSRRGK